jgi:hypothetical protein
MNEMLDSIELKNPNKVNELKNEIFESEEKPNI